MRKVPQLKREPDRLSRMDARGVARFPRHPYHALRRLEHRRSLDRVRETPHVIATPGRDLGYGVGAERTGKSRQYTL